MWRSINDCSFSLISHWILYRYYRLLICKHTKPLEWQEKWKKRTTEKTSKKEKKNLVLQTILQCQFKKNIQTHYKTACNKLIRQKLSFRCSLISTMVVMMMMMIGLKLKSCVTPARNNECHQLTHTHSHYQKWRCGKMVRIFF